MEIITYKKIIIGTTLNRKKMKSTGTEASNINLERFSFQLKFLNFRESIGMFETISHDRRRMIANRV
jgi:hypothetical protein